MIHPDKDPMGQAIADYFAKKNKRKIVVTSPDVEDDFIPVEYLFRTFKDMPRLEQQALEISSGKVLDVGAGAGSHALYLQQKGLEVTALEYSEKACNIMRERGVKNIVCEDIYSYSTSEKYDTLLLLMNGIGLTGELQNITKLLSTLFKLLAPGGQIIFDSSDLCFLFQEDLERMMEDTYYGEIHFTMKYQSVTSDPFTWLYIDFDTMQQFCTKEGYNLSLLSEGEHFDYLASISQS